MTHQQTTPAPAAIEAIAPPAPGERPSANERLEDVRFSIRSGRLTHWQRGVSETLTRAGLGEGYSMKEWAETAWYGPLETWLAPGSLVSDILINGPEREVMVIDAGRRMNTGVILHEEWVQFIQRQLALRGGFTSPDAPDDWRNPNGAISHTLVGSADRRLRFALTRPPASPDGPSISLRVLPQIWRTLDDLCNAESGVLPRQAATFLLDAVRHGNTVLVAGGTGSGKTTLTAALLLALGEEKRIVVIEDARELPPVPDGVAIEVLQSGKSFAECVRLTLRMKVDMIVLGEVRGPEALAMLQAAATGHPGIGTIHAPDADAALRNLERMACEDGSIPPAIVRGMIASDTVPIYVVHIGRYGGRRRVGRIDEVLVAGAGTAGDKYPTSAIFEFDPRSEQLVARPGAVRRAWGRGRY